MATSNPSQQHPDRSSTAGPSRQPQPGDGAYLAAARPSDAASLSNGQSETGRSGGQGRRGRGGHMDHHRAERTFQPIPRGQYHGGRQVTKPPIGMNGDTLPNGIGDLSINTNSHRLPSRPRQARALDRIDAAKTVSEVKVLRNVSEPQLDPSAQSFVPASVFRAPVPVSILDGTPSPVLSSLPSHRSRSEDGRKPQNRRKPPKRKDDRMSAPPSPGQAGGHRTNRRAAFEQQSKLTATMSRPNSVNNGKDQRIDDEVDEHREKQKRQEDKDDLFSRLTRGLKQRPFLECPICFNPINPAQPIWSCLPPQELPQPQATDLSSINPITGAEIPATWYQSCYTPFHLHCIRDWATRNIAEDAERLRNIGREGDEASWRCPGCQKRRAERVAIYRCFCGKVSNPATLGNAPHSCGDSCSRKRPGCSHACPLTCHPGPCPPCQVALVVPCPSHYTALTVKCAIASTNNAALTPVCDEPCEKETSCGHRDHACQRLCHLGPCAPCDERESVSCFCGGENRQEKCGWKRADEQRCARLFDDGEEEAWIGRYSCGRGCEEMYDCGIHPCNDLCHPHPILPLSCPRSPSRITSCPCGTTPLSRLPGFPRADCIAPIPTCHSPCPQSRPCGHQCPRTCHSGECPPCHEEVVRPCRCGESVLVVQCDEMRERKERGEGEMTCERVCRALRNCGRHECGRLCCPLSYRAKSKKERKKEEHEIIITGEDELHDCHLPCGKLLSCGLHPCPKKDHKGACGRCLQASYDELICHCGHTVVYPPVACGITIMCMYPCARPAPSCGHPKSPHTCHETSDCPPCPFLASKACACGKDKSVKNVRCSQERVSCGQPCGQLLACGYHKCERQCHRPGECESCTQACGKPKRICQHPCTAMCHAPAKCSENDPCQTIITQSCACGNVQNRTTCFASISNTTSKESIVLKCNSECTIRQRNARLADALGIQPKERVTVEWTEELKAFSRQNSQFVKTVESTFKEFFSGTKQNMVLPYMPSAKRAFVLSLAEQYRLSTKLVDEEPRRSIIIRRRVDTRIPAPLLSVTAPAPVAKSAVSLGGLANLRSSTSKGGIGSGSWGRKIEAGAEESSREGSRAPSPSRIGNAVGAPTGLGGREDRGGGAAGLFQVTPGGGATPSAAGKVGAKSGRPVGQVGKVEEDDWDQSGDEA